MKLKFKASSKDWMIFGFFCLLILYLVCLAVLNLSYFSQYGRLYPSLLPFEAFKPEYLMATIVGFIAIIAIIIASVSSYFFEREKGFGLSTEAKKEKGYSHWETEKEFKKQLKRVLPGDPNSDIAGIPLINNGKEIWVDPGQYHNLIIGSTGSGKTEMIVQPMVKMLAKKGESMVITDPKGEIYENNAVELREKGYNVVLLNFRNPQQGNSWNPLTLPLRLYKNGNKDKATELIDDLAANILYDDKAQNQDPFWEKTSADYFAGLALSLFADAKEEEINLNSINLMTTAGEDKCGPSTYIKEYFSFKEQSSPEYINVSATLTAPSDTKSSILSVFKQKIKMFSSKENLAEMLSYSDFEMDEIGTKKTAVFIVIQDEKKTYHSLATIFLKQCYETLIDVAQQNGGKLKYKTNFILDEFANMPPLKDVTTMVTAARSREIRFTFIIQNFAQLYQVYGKENGETIKGNCGNIIYLISSELAALEEISKMCGEVKSKEKDKTASTPLVTVSDLQRLPMGHIIVLRTRCMPFKTRLKYNWEMELENAWGNKYPKSDYPQREKKPVALFDIKKFVDAKKDEKIDQMLNNLAASNSSGGGSSKPKSSINPSDFFKGIDSKMSDTPSKPAVVSPLSSQEKDSIKASVAAAIKESKTTKPEISKPVEKKSLEEEIKASLEKAKKEEVKPSVIPVPVQTKKQEELEAKQKEAEKKFKEVAAKLEAENKKQEELEAKQREAEKKIAAEKKKQEELEAKQKEAEKKYKEAAEKFEAEKKKQEELDAKQKEAERKFKEAAEKFEAEKKKQEELEAKQKEAERKFKEAAAKFEAEKKKQEEQEAKNKAQEEKQREAELLFKETAEKLRISDKKQEELEEKQKAAAVKLEQATKAVEKSEMELLNERAKQEEERIRLEVEKNRLEQEKKAKELAEKKAKEEAEKKAKEEAEKAKLAAEKAKEEQKRREALEKEQEKIKKEEEEAKRIAKEREEELRKFEEKRRQQEIELQKQIKENKSEPPKYDSNDYDITEDEFFDDFFNDEDE